MAAFTRIGDSPILQQLRERLKNRQSESAETRPSRQEGSVSVMAPPIVTAPPHREWLTRHWHRHSMARVTDLAPDLIAAYEGSRAAGRGLYLSGPTGTGKTWALVALFDAVCMERWITYGSDAPLPEPALWSWRGIVNEIKRDFKRDDADLRPYAAPYFRAIDPLFVDDIGVGRMTGWEAGEIYDLIENRGEAGRLTYFTSNHALPILGAVLNQAQAGNEAHTLDGDRVVSRLSEQCDGYPFTGPDRR